MVLGSAVDQQDIATALRLEAPAARRGLDLAWLERSHVAPGPFFEALYEVLGQVARPGPKSSAQGYDLYGDLVTRHCGRGAEALRTYDPRRPEGERWRSSSFDELHTRCRRRAAQWVAQGVKPGALLCMVLPAGEEAYISLLTGLRLGAIVSLLEPQGPDFLARRLAALAPAFVVSDDYYVGWLGGPDALGAPLLLDTGNDEGLPQAGSYTYAPAEPCAMLFSPLRPEPELPVELGAEQLFRGALRDGAVALALRPGDRLAAPGFDWLQHQPALLCAALIMGATWVELDLPSALADPNLIRELPLRSVGLGAELREALSEQSGGARPRWDHVFKNPEEPAELVAWREFVDLLELDEVYASNLLIEAASGGALLSSPRRSAKEFLAHFLELHAAAGRAWTLLDFSGSGQPSLGEVGVFSLLAGVELEGDEGEPSGPSYICLGRRRGPSYLYGGPITPRRAGRVYPAKELLESLGDCPFLEASSVLAFPAGGQTLAYRFVLVGYVGHESVEDFEAGSEARIEEITRVIGTRLGEAFQPDHIELFRGFARHSEGEVDHRWCYDQFVSGTTYRKHKSPLFQRMRALRAAFESVGEP